MLNVANVLKIKHRKTRSKLQEKYSLLHNVHEIHPNALANNIKHGKVQRRNPASGTSNISFVQERKTVLIK